MNRPILTALLAAGALAATGASAVNINAISQKNRAFSPREITITRGESLVFENDDGELLHHVYSPDPGAAFDIGEQPPGARVPVRFARPGTFSVRCLIHPRMALTVVVK